MGIRGLNKLISNHSKTTQENISKFKGSKIAIDSEILIYKYRANNTLNCHIHGFINNALWYIKNGITPVYIFDGTPTDSKIVHTLTKRVSQKKKILKKAEDLEDKFIEQLEQFDKTPNKNNTTENSSLSPEMNETLDELLKAQRKIITVTKNHRKECKYILKLMGIPFLDANEDAEALCVELQYQNKVDYVYTEDTDALTYAASKLEMKDPTRKSLYIPIILRKGNLPDTVTTTNLNEVLTDFEMTPGSFVDLCILNGCDFCTTIPRIGPIKSYNAIKKYGCIEDFISTDKIVAPLFNYQEARDIFYNDHSISIEKSLDIDDANIQELKVYLENERHMNSVPIINRYYSDIKSYLGIKNDLQN
jgi:flap endonuclease-1